MPKLHPLLVIGGSAIDLMSSVNKSLLDSRPVKHKKNDESEEEDVTSYPGSVLVHVGGVGQNIARAACSLGAKSYLISAIAHDFYGDTIVESMKQAKMPTSFLQCMDNPARTAVCNTFRWTNGKILAAVADMDINDMLSVQHIEKAFKTLKPSVVALDGNIPVPVLSNIVTLAKNKGACIVFEPTSGPKCTKLLSALSFIKGSETNADVSGLVQMITPNKLEAKEMAEAAVRFKLVDSRPLDSMVSKISKDLSSLDAGLIRDALTLFPIFPLQAITLGNKGVAVVSPMPDHSETPSIRHIRARVPDLIINSNGAGDSFVGALLALLYNNQAAALSSDGAIILESKDIDRIVWLAQKASILSLESDIAVSNKLSPALLEEG
ncbi:hypothetical protein IW140_003411 [Coemansia sp. RSA 1813]|nr:hypothetical protein EV178_003228 [Coemansia sp. RSA 1646]KAJ2089275.1 hypothetical protein IW138_003595 [Coemansia sp. RSA 986]KAJ2215104.1 hypothetical protein EV179_002472 [Coemansia sp. RSA 487]KAJ2569046.1 hypothetical protein IW140_003411 [Coemansia sp. RSA 1813]